jgi:molecular chaperone Hsp33
MGDYFVRATTVEGWSRVLAAVTTELTREAARRHQTSATATAALGRAMTAAALMTGDLKADHRVTIRVDGDGPLGTLMADAGAKGGVRGYLQNPTVELPLTETGKLNVGAAVGANGLIYVTRDLGLREPYTGSAPLVSGEIAEDLTNYYWQSEQRRTVTALGVLVGADGNVLAAGGVIMEALPDATEKRLHTLEQNASEFAAISRRIHEGFTPERLVSEAMAGLKYKLLGEQELRFHCSCSLERARDLMAALNPTDLCEMIDEDGGAELTCHWCGEAYRFSNAELREILSEAES